MTNKVKLSNKRFKVKDLEKMRTIVREDNINIRLDAILEKVQKNPDERLSQEETELLKNNVAKLQEVDIDWRASIIYATGDKDFIKACLEDKSFEFYEYQRGALIIATQDSNYIKENIDDKSEKIDIRAQLVEALSGLTSYFDYMKYVTDFVRAETSTLSSFDKVKLISSIGRHPQMDMDTYIMYLEGRLKEKELLLRQMDKINLIEKLRELEDMQVKIPDKSGRVELSRYEWQILRWMRENRFDLNGDEKSQLITSTENPLFYNICLSEDKLLDSAGKAGVLRGFGRLENVTTNQYLEIVMNAVQNEAWQLEEVYKFNLLKDLRNIKELTEPTEELEIRGKKIKISQYDRIISRVLLNDKKIISDSFLKGRIAYIYL